MPLNASARRWSSAAVCAVLGVVCIVSLHDAGAAYGDFAVPLEGVERVPERELAFLAWYALWGTLATGFFATALLQARAADSLVALAARLFARPWLAVGGAAVVVLAWALALRFIVLLDHPVTDDEITYAFQAQTLVRGRIVNPLPPNPDLFANKFVLLNDYGWYGKYPIGHPLVLAVGEAVGLRLLVVPVLGALSVLFTFLLGRKLFDSKRAALGTALLCVSPQFVATHATQLSQPTSCLFMLLGMWALLRLQDDARLRWAALAGLAWGFVLLARPMPGAPFLVAALVGWFAAGRDGAFRLHAWSARAKELACAAPGVLAGAGLVLWVNMIESGAPTQSAYALSGATEPGALVREVGIVANSFGGALLRQNFWLFGWTLSFAFVALARPRRAGVLFWAIIVAEYSYRFFVPKTVVAVTGPIYVFEIVPLLALATADGALRAAGLLGRLDAARARAWVAAPLVAASVVALFGFVPPQIEALHRSSTLRERIYEGLRQKRASRALVFANRLVEPERGATWAYHPPNPSPDLDDDIVFVRLPLLPGGMRYAYDFWRREFPDRRAFVYLDAPRQLVFEEFDAADAPAANASLADLVRARALPR